ncbi:Helicase associated domain protein [Nocardia sp. NPDC049220]|uniref:DEAD/DEAH box helicase n=1 Tax=Nocardia sp. NPDC049220 TaxID=3155273 RepID=UPI0033F547C1
MSERARPRLRPHQQAAATAAVAQLLGGGRATVVAACGTGKTFVGAAVADRLAPHGRVLILVPTLELLAQNVAEWMRWGRGGQVIAVCSQAEALHQHHHAPVGEVSTSPAVIAALGRVEATATWFATYASLPQLTAAQHDHGLPAFDLLVADEAHRTAGRMGRRWSSVHHDTLLAATRRLYLTATPRVFDDTTGDEIASMHDPAVFGPIVHRLGFGEAIDAQLLADYRVIVPVVTDTELAALATTGSAGSELAAQIAVLRAATQYGLRRVISYHSRVAGARGFATRLPEAYHLLPAAQRPADLWSGWITGKHRLAERHRALRELRSDTHDFALLANARVLNEGVDVPAVDAIVLNDPKRSMIDTIQAVGRALRTGGVRGKIATIVVPAVISGDDDPESVFDSAGYTTVWRVLRALRAHDDRLDERLTALARDPGSGREDAAAVLDWLHIDGVPRAGDLALAISLRLIDPKSAEWRRGYAAARRHHARHGHLDTTQDFRDDKGFRLGGWLSWQRWLHRQGSLPAHRVTALNDLGIVWEPRKDQWERGMTAARRFHAEHGHLSVELGTIVDGINLGAWLHNRRTRSEALSPARRRELDALDPWWNPPWRLSWQRLYRCACAYHAEHGHLEIPRTHIRDNMRLGEWVHAQRRSRDTLDDRQRELLDALGIDWNTVSPFEMAWRRGLSAAIDYYEQHNHLQVPQKYVDPSGYRLGIWISAIRSRRRQGSLPSGRIAALDALGMTWTAPPKSQTQIADLE